MSKAPPSECARRQFVSGVARCLGGAVTIGALLPAELRALPVRGLDPCNVPTAASERAFPIPAADSVSIDRAASMILVRAQGRMWAFALACPHEQAAVLWSVKEAKFICTKHASKYLPDGKYLSGRATRHMDRFPIRQDGGHVIVTLDRVFRADQDAVGWAAAEVTV